ncbi:6-carboxytetrahydropterin synthase [Chelativorans sp. YIM 93263]|uniref:6-carboxytetrahydropterin synthase n=1 Tax=Chelativorans sp. YIM 93263 TaxID=2906648 RepID=UPI0023798712|nr:6-carboxytetrahydropterin synthase [Chelativorans sp. YIM 93263]
MTTTVETFTEFTFEAAHELKPHEGLHGHSFKVRIHLTGEPDPTFGWPANLYEVEKHVSVVRKRLDHSFLNEIEGLSVPSLENVAGWIWKELESKVSTLSHVVVSRGVDGQAEGCIYRG